MKLNFRNRIAPIFTFFLAIQSPVAAFDIADIPISAPHISFSPYVEGAFGEAYEYVYTQDQIYSELIWDMKPMISAGLSASVFWDGGLRVSAEGSGAIPMQTGSMQDSDWFNIPVNGSMTKTTYSKHDADLEFAYQTRIEAGWELRTGIKGPWSEDKLSIVPSIGFRFMNWKWSGNNGYIQHPDEKGSPSLPGGVYRDWSEDAEKKTASGTVISYQQTYWVPLVKLGISIPVGQTLRLGASWSQAFWLYCNGIDTHFTPTEGWDYTDSKENTQYFDFLAGGYMMEPELSIVWKSTDRFSLFAEGTWTWIGNLRGDTYKKSSSSTTYTRYALSDGEGAGAALTTAAIRLGVEISIR